ncbi:hypothetical protein L3Q82_016664 [Scortum barcoo]|uniref:Uncharacterized protein n=1 Tax=Scortum barcoo TaxID=214431 RepID=A0ACB8X7N6_9TELE|nr:hypothetical protein L3Q82_016664 [Scortum barcoo]
MRTRSALLRACVLSSLLLLLCSTCAGVAAGRETASPHHQYHKHLHQHSASGRSRRSHRSAQAGSAQHHRPLTDAQQADQNLQFMLSLYRSAAEPDGRPKQHRKFGSNTVRLLRPTASSVHYLPASRDHHYSFTVQYNVDTLPSEQLIRASFIHLRSSSSSSSDTRSAPRALEPPRCRAQIASLGKDSLVTLEPHERWMETDITAHVRQGTNRDPGGHLTLTAQYWCMKPGDADEDSGLLWWWAGGRGGWRDEPHLEVPSVLLYLEEEREVKDWMGDLLGAEGEHIMRRIVPWHPALHRHRRSKDSAEPKDPSLDALKNAPTSSSSPSTNSSSSFATAASASILGWGHYFIAPPVYNPRFCQGGCPRVLHYGYHSPNHAIIQTAINDLGVGDVPLPSCVPYKYMPMSVLVVHKKRVEYRELEDMVAESCTCR